MQAILRKKTKNTVPIKYIPNWADHNETFPVYHENFRFESDRSLVFQFFGNIGRLQDVQNILEAISLVKSQNVLFSFVGSGGESERVEDYIASVKDSRIIYHGPCQMAMKNEALSMCDIALVSLKPGMYGLAVPSKAYFSLAANKPLIVIGDKGSELKLLVDEYGLGWFCDAGSPIKLANLIDQICRQNTFFTEMNVRQTLIENFSERKSLQAIHKIIEGL